MQHILFFVSSMQGGGAERVAALLCNHWVGSGRRVTLMPTFSGRGECIYPLDERVRLDYLTDRVGTTRKSIRSKISRLWTLRQVVRDEKADVVVSFLPHVNVAAILAAAGSGVPVVVSERIYPPMMPVGPVLERLRRMLYPRASAVVMQTEQGRTWLNTTAPKARGVVIPNPVEFPLPGGNPRIEPADVVSADTKIVLAVGRLSEQKRFDRAISAFATLAETYPDWDMVILGEGRERVALETLRDSLGLRSRIHLPGWAGNLADWYRRADLYCMSSQFEGFPNTLLEAMAHGLPAVSVDCDTGPRDIIRHGVDGFLAPADEAEKGLAHGLETLMAAPETRESFGRAAGDVRERFSMERVASAWEAVLGL